MDFQVIYCSIIPHAPGPVDWHMLCYFRSWCSQHQVWWSGSWRFSKRAIILVWNGFGTWRKLELIKYGYEVSNVGEFTGRSGLTLTIQFWKIIYPTYMSSLLCLEPFMKRSVLVMHYNRMDTTNVSGIKWKHFHISRVSEPCSRIWRRHDMNGTLSHWHGIDYIAGHHYGILHHISKHFTIACNYINSSTPRAPWNHWRQSISTYRCAGTNCPLVLTCHSSCTHSTGYSINSL